MATKGTVYLFREGTRDVLTIIACSCNGHKAKIVANSIKDKKTKAFDLSELYKIAKQEGFGCEKCLVVMDKTRILSYADDDYDYSLYKKMFDYSYFWLQPELDAGYLAILEIPFEQQYKATIMAEQLIDIVKNNFCIKKMEHYYLCESKFKSPFIDIPVMDKNDLKLSPWTKSDIMTESPCYYKMRINGGREIIATRSEEAACEQVISKIIKEVNEQGFCVINV